MDRRAGRDKARRGAPSSLQNYLSEGRKRYGGRESGTELTGPCGVAPGALALRAAFRCSVEGRSVAPSGIIYREGRKRRYGLEIGTKIAGLWRLIGR